MKTKKITRLKISAICASIALVICAVAAWSLIASNAFAANDEATNDTCQISFNIEGIPSGVDPKFKLEKDGVKLDYTLGQKIDAETGEILEYSKQEKGYSISIKGIENSSPQYIFYAYNLLGIDFDNCPQEGTTSLTGNIDFKIIFKKTTEPYKIRLLVNDENEVPVEGAWVKLYYPDTKTSKTGTTGSDGFCDIEGLQTSEATGCLITGHDDYTDGMAQVNSDTYDGTHICKPRITIYPRTSANIVLENPGGHHKTYEITALIKEGGVVSQDIDIQKDSFCYLSSVEGTWKGSSNGKLTLQTSPGPGYEVTMSLKPIAEDGYSLVKWKLDRGQNAEEYYAPGEDIEIGEGDKLCLEPIYEESPEPGPEPTPTPSEEANATPQTGDLLNAILPLAILTAVSAAALIARRRIAQK